MFRNQYDSDVTVWSPQGRMHQVDYAVEAMKQGSATVGIKSETHAVLAALKRAQNELCSHQKKIYEIDTHAGVSIAGLLSDGRILARFLQTECSSWRWDYKVPVPISSLADSVQLKLQANTQYYGRRPFGVGLLIAGYDKDGTHIVQSDPSAEVVEMFASSIGARSQSARTYLERHLEKFRNGNLTSQNTSIAIVGKGQSFKIMDDSEVAPYLTRIRQHTADYCAGRVVRSGTHAAVIASIAVEVIKQCLDRHVYSVQVLYCQVH
ncbi:Proteasome subunit alpha type-1 [Parelaphostrongylus tenuis]|uniref:Proteasome subunit alpha type n=1 Tax=Parelaphostrongylus tenuis TaxID=148309 RepID=A0AAD5NBB0_PARTN|nr:Proteasome subunit alpha type-1 [Parelaphostrongylus tenuis]